MQKVTLSWIIALLFSVVHFICLRKLTFTLLRVTSAFRLLRSLQPTQNPLGVVWNLNPQSYSDRYNLVMLGKNAQPTTSEGDLSKCSPEFKQALIDFGMSEWEFDLK